MAGKGESFSMKPCSHASMEEAEEGELLRRAGKEESSLKPCSQKGGSKSVGELSSLKPCSAGGMAAAEAFTASESVEAVGEDCALKVCPTKRKKLTARHVRGQEQGADDSSDVSKLKAVEQWQASHAVKVALVAEKGELGNLPDDSEDEDGQDQWEDGSSDEDTVADVEVKTIEQWQAFYAAKAALAAEKGELGNLSDDSEDEVISNSEKDGSAVDDDDDEKSVTESEFAAFLEKGRAEYQRYWEEEFLPRNPHMVFKDFSKEGDDWDKDAEVEDALESN